MTTTDRTALPAVAAVDPFSPEVLEDPLPFQAALRDAGPVVPLTRYDDLYGMGRYADVHAALVDWQRFCSSAGVGLSNFRREAPWRPPSLLLEADPPHHDAPRRVLAPILGPRALRRLRERWFAVAEEHVDALLAGAGPVLEVDAMPALAEAFPLRVFPDAVGIPREGREHLLPYGDHLFNAFGPPNDLVAKGAPHVAEHAGWVNAQCAREVLSDDGFGAAIWAAADRGDITHDAGAAGGALAALGRRRHHGPRPRGRAARDGHPPRGLGTGCAPTRRCRGWRSRRRSAGSRRSRRSSAPPRSTCRSATPSSPRAPRS